MYALEPLYVFMYLKSDAKRWDNSGNWERQATNSILLSVSSSFGPCQAPPLQRGAAQSLSSCALKEARLASRNPSSGSSSGGIEGAQGQI